MNYVITIDKEHNGDAWWTAYNATLHPDARTARARLCTQLRERVYPASVPS